jgi:hypothetical protein
MIIEHSATVDATLDDLVDTNREMFLRGVEESLNLPIPVDNLEYRILRCNVRENTVTILVSGTTEEEALDYEAVS